MTEFTAAVEDLRRPWMGIGIGAFVLMALSLLASSAGFAISQKQFFASYLFSFMFWISIPLGSLGLLLLYHIVGGYWGLTIRRCLEAASATIPFMGLMFVPLIFGIKSIYPWADPETVALDPVLIHKSAYLNEPFWVLRTIVCFAVWTATVWILLKLSMKQEDDPEGPHEGRMQRVAPLALVLFVLTVTFASMDWGMTLEPLWISTIYGPLFIMGQALLALSSAVYLLSKFHHLEPVATVVHPTHFHDVGTLLFAFVMLWAYMALCQFLIIWSANIPEEIHWYLHRTHGGWEVLGLAIVAFQFVMPFGLLLSRTVKRDARLLGRVAVLILVVRVVDVFWLVMPSIYPHGFHLHVLDLLAMAGIGGTWISLFLLKLAESDPYPDFIADALGEGASHG